MREFSEDERKILQQAKAFAELLDTAGWRVYSAVLDAQIREREHLLEVPLSSEALQGDFATRAAKLELIKGALIGLRLARDTPSATMAHAKQMLQEAADETPASTNEGNAP